MTCNIAVEDSAAVSRASSAPVNLPIRHHAATGSNHHENVDTDSEDQRNVINLANEDDVEIEMLVDPLANLELPHRARPERVDAREATLSVAIQADLNDVSPFWVIQESVKVVEGFTLTPGVTVELADSGEFICVFRIYQDASTNEIFLRGLRLRRNSDMDNMMSRTKNEVCAMQQLNENDARANRLRLGNFALQSLNIVPLARETVFTNAVHMPNQMENITFRSQEWWNEYRHAPEEEQIRMKRQARETAKLICRWKYTRIYGCDQNESFERLTQDECNPGLFFPSHIPARTSLNGQYRYTFMDGFCCSGFASQGAKMAGLNIICAFDNDRLVVVSYQWNHREVPIYPMDAHDFVTEFARAFEGKIDVLHLSFPCQWFAHCHTVPGRNDFLNEIAILSLKLFLAKLRPRILVMEETSGLSNIAKHQDNFHNMIEDITASNYSVRWKVMNFVEHGIAQQRRRLITIAAAPGESLPPFPKPTHTKDLTLQNRGLKRCVTVADVLRTVVRDHPNHNPEIVMYLADRRKAPYDPNCQLRTIVCSGDYPHPNGLRAFTEHELALLQGAPPHHFVLGTKTEARKQIGNASPSNVMAQIYTECRKSLEKTDRRRAQQQQMQINRARTRAAQIHREEEEDDHEEDEEAAVARAIALSMHEYVGSIHEPIQLDD